TVTFKKKPKKVKEDEAETTFTITKKQEEVVESVSLDVTVTKEIEVEENVTIEKEVEREEGVLPDEKEVEKPEETVTFKKKTKKVKEEEAETSFTLTKKPEEEIVPSVSLDITIAKEFESDESLLSPEIEILTEVEVDEYYAKYNYNACRSNELSLREGDKVYILRRKNDEWWLVRKHETKEKGYVPSRVLVHQTSYTHILDEKEIEVVEVDDKQLVEESKSIKLSKRLSLKSETEERFEEYIVKSSYTAKSESEISVNEGEKVLVIEKQTNEYWFVRRSVKKQEGLIPKSILFESEARKRSKQTEFEGELVAPKFIEKIKSITVQDGQSVTFTCKLIGNPQPQVTWYHKTSFITESENIKITYEENTCSLTFLETFPEDSGTYSVVAKNIAGFATSSAELIVEGPPSDPALAMSFTEEAMDASVTCDTATTSWMREENVDPVVRSYTKHILYYRTEYFFRIRYRAEKDSKLSKLLSKRK
ncbi:Titin-like protein, partial [Dinothrombium tinctorium]